MCVRGVTVAAPNAPCPAGRYKPPGSTTCVDCPTGFYCPSVASSTPCDVSAVPCGWLGAGKCIDLLNVRLLVTICCCCSGADCDVVRLSVRTSFAAAVDHGMASIEFVLNKNIRCGDIWGNCKSATEHVFECRQTEG